MTIRVGHGAAIFDGERSMAQAADGEAVTVCPSGAGASNGRRAA